MTREQRAEYAEWCRQRANALAMLDVIDGDHPELERLLTGEDFKLFVKAQLAIEQALVLSKNAMRDYEALAEGLEANAD